MLVHAHLQEPLSRWLWLVKWVLLLPHYVVLAFLWVAFVLVTVVAFVAILVTGRYPRRLFHFNLGVLRWGWRVSYYGYSALGTDRYPPFTLSEAADYPATLDIPYPQRLSRGLVLVKWWLLALPHYLVLAVVTGSAFVVADAAEQDPGGWSVGAGGLLGLLVLFAGVALLFTARYPRGLFDLVLGLDRWVLRVLAYAALMTDAYPPFRLDQGGADVVPPVGPGPAGPTAVPRSEPAGAPTRPVAADGAGGPGAGGTGPTGARSGGVGAVVALVTGLLLLVPGAGLVALGGTALAVDAQRDPDGYTTAPERTLSSPTAVISVEDVDLDVDAAAGDWLSSQGLGTLRVRATATDGGEVFVGIAPQSALDPWLEGVEHDRVEELGFRSALYQRQEGAPSAGPPADADFWVASVEGTGPQELTWPATDGRWGLVLAGADGTPGVDVVVDVGARLPELTPVAVPTLVGGVVLLGLAAALVLAGAVGLGGRHAPPTGRTDPDRTGPHPPAPPVPPQQSSSPHSPPARTAASRR
ncbi:DUF4389 domain-containing protein [Aquipuribacter sp. MA13-6]|uniref:DUF4389 domain-containing protein n=1 Tax=Aquipuribacter sp. MA13-6 TaxID=3440839 RepID=UPI003EEC0EA3